MLKLSCPECGFSKDVPLDKIPKGTSSATCPKCNFRFGIRDISKCKSSDTTINVNIKNIDVARAILYANLRNKFLWGLPIISGILIYFDAFSIVYMFGFPFIETCIVITSYIFYILSITIISYIITVFCLLCNKKWRKGRVGNHTLSLEENGITEATEYNKSEYKWSAINNIVAKESMIFIAHSGNEIFVVPRRDFASKEEWDNFIKTLMSRWESVKANKGIA